MAKTRSIAQSSHWAILHSLYSETLERRLFGEVFQQETYDNTAHFHCVSLWPEQRLRKKYKKILALDIDDSIIDNAESVKTGKLVFIHLEKLKQKIQYAIANNILVVIVTARYTEHLHNQEFLTVRNIINVLGAENFARIFFTNGHCKKYVMDFLWDYHFESDPKKKKCICLYDDLQDYLEPVMWEYVAVRADKTDLHGKGLDAIQNFMESKPVQRLYIVTDTIELPVEEDKLENKNMRNYEAFYQIKKII